MKINENTLLIPQEKIFDSSGFEWSQRFGGSQLDWGWDVKQTADGGYLIAGETTSFGAGGYDAWLIKTDSDGHELWNTTFGGVLKDGTRSVLVTSDSCAVMAGYTDSFGYSSAHDFWLIKTDSMGNELWNRTYGGEGSDAGFSVFQTSDGGFIITGYTYSYGAGANDIWLVKTDPLGYEVWNKTFGGSKADYGMSVQQTMDQGFIIAGVTSSFGIGSDDGWLIKTNANGNELWNRTFGGSSKDWFGSVAQTHDGGYILTGDTASISLSDYDAWFIKTDPSGVTQWQTVLREPNYHETGYSIKEMKDGSFIATGSITSINTYQMDLWVKKISTSGEEQWCLIFPGDLDDCGYSIYPTNDGGCVSVGYTDSFGLNSRNVILIKLSSHYDNLPPRIPTLSGPSKGIVGMAYTYSMSTTDPNEDPIRYGWDDGDGIIDFWTQYYSSGAICNISMSFVEPGTYSLHVKAKDIYGTQSNFSQQIVVVIKDFNHPPDIPDKPLGVTNAMIGASYFYSVTTTDPDRDTIRYGWDWDDDENIDQWTDFYSSGTTIYTAHTFTTIGNQTIKVIAEDEYGAQSLFSFGLQIIVLGNAPNKPNAPSGTLVGKINELYVYQTSTIDLDGDAVYYMWDWGDNTAMTWAGPFSSGENITTSHKWTEKGIYNVKVKTKDTTGLESNWSDPLPITMPYTIKPIWQQFFDWLFQRFPMLFL